MSVRLATPIRQRLRSIHPHATDEAAHASPDGDVLGVDAEPSRASSGPLRVVSGRVEAGFWMAVVLSAITMSALFVTFGDQLMPLEQSGWVIAPIGFGLFLVVAKWWTPDAFETVRVRRLLGPAVNYDARYRWLESWLNSKVSLVLLGFGAIVLSGYLRKENFFVNGTRAAGWTYAEFLEVVVATGLASIAGIGLWRMLVIGIYVAKVARSGELVIDLQHPDGHAGLGALGRACANNALVIAVPAALLAFWLVRGIVAPYAADAPLDVHAALLLSLIVSALVAFAFPIGAVHLAMKREAGRVSESLERHSALITQLAHDLIDGDPRRPQDELRRKARDLRLRRAIYRRESKLPTWPLSLRDTVPFAVSEAIAVAGFVASALEWVPRVASGR